MSPANFGIFANNINKLNEGIHPKYFPFSETNCCSFSTGDQGIEETLENVRKVLVDQKLFSRFQNLIETAAKNKAAQE
ncbi:hypothetical protein, partial [Salmonella sp. SAL4438]|uniref:hypothetical protein n=1 Tax=Salmonella sp. SAL4438 TaxID=3159893 RepID=UPI00397BD0B1